MSNEKLHNLLEIVIDTLVEANQVVEVEEVVFGADGDTDGTKTVRKIPPPAYLGAAITLLKNQNITMPEGNDARKKLEATIAARRAAAKGKAKDVESEAMEDYKFQSGVPYQ